MEKKSLSDVFRLQLKNSANPRQREAIAHISGPMLVLAGPGSGKTYVITKRIQNLIEHTGVYPGKILVITFTKAAAKEMQNRSISDYPKAANVSFGTFHSIFFHILKTYQEFKNFIPISETQKQKLVLDIMSTMSFSKTNLLEEAEEFMKWMSLYKNDAGTGAQQTEDRKQIYLQILKAYQKECRQSMRLDFDDMVRGCYHMLIKYPDTLKKWQDMFEYIMIDEFQDINALQYQVIRLLAGERQNVFVVGDDDQSIYGFRGSDPAFMQSFIQDYNHVKICKLEMNYRCCESIISISNQSISHNKNRLGKTMLPFKRQKGKVSVSAYEDMAGEAAAIYGIVMECEKENKTMGILFRSGRKLREYESLVHHSEKAAHVHMKTEVLKDLYALIEFAHGKPLREHFIRFMNKPDRGILRISLTSEQIDFKQLMEYYRQNATVYEHIERLQKDIQFLQKLDAYSMLNFIEYGMGYEKAFRNTGKDSIEKVRVILDIFSEYKEIAKQLTEPFAFLQLLKKDIDFYMQKQNEKTKSFDEKGRIRFMTYHGSKGLEFDVVYLPGVNQGHTPYGHFIDEEKLEEERRMFYVAMTRAKEALYISYQDRESSVKSIFLTELSRGK